MSVSGHDDAVSIEVPKGIHTGLEWSLGLTSFSA